ncbi:MAG TPA: hypothetical protein GX716_06725 [Firmicutes bacterium]|nr:hypothetical protein [Candidatus Fermentithermobacillaceae bacterium]
MSERRGLVVKRYGNKVTAITKSGEFVTWRDRGDLMPGEEVLVPSPRFQGLFWHRLVPAAALAVVLIFGSFFGYRHYLYARPVLAYVTFDSSGEVPGSVELEVNDRGLVKKAVALDEAGAQALTGLKIEMQPVQTVLARLQEAMTNGGKVVVAFIPATPDDQHTPLGVDEIGEDGVQSSRISNLARQVFDSVKEAQAVVLDMETRAVAKELGLSAGRAASWAMWETKEPESDPTPGQGEHQIYSEPGESQPSGGDDDPGTSGDPAGATTPHEFPHQGTGTEPSQGTQPGQWIDPGQPGTTGGTGGSGKPDKVPPGQQKKEDAQALLDMIRNSLPEFDWDTNRQGDSKKASKELEKLTKEWLKALKEASKKSDKAKDDDRKDDDRKDDDRKDDDWEKGSGGKPKPSNQTNAPSKGNTGNQNPGKDQGKPGSPGSQGPNKEEKDGGKSKDDKSKTGSDQGKSSGSKGKTQPGKADKNDGPGNKGAAVEDGDGKTLPFFGEYTESRDSNWKSPSLADRFRWTSEFFKRLWK